MVVVKSNEPRARRWNRSTQLAEMCREEQPRKSRGTHAPFINGKMDWDQEILEFESALFSSRRMFRDAAKVARYITLLTLYNIYITTR